METGRCWSPGTTTSEVLTSLIGFTLLYGALAVVEVKLMFRAIRAGLDPVEPDDAPDQPDKPLSFAY